MTSYENFINGEWTPSASGERYQTKNPADLTESVGDYPLSGAVETQQAIAAAKDAFSGWSAQTSIARGRVLSAVAGILAERKGELAKLLTREEGKTLLESTMEVGRAIDIFRFFGGLSYTLGGQTIPHDFPNNLLYTVKEPLGVVGLITPWNFPIAIPAWKLAPALVSGNTVVVKPASQSPALTFELAKALDEAGLPKGVLNIVTGPGSAVGGEIASNPDIAAVSFTGSHQVGHGIYQKLATRMARSQMEMGGKNPTIVLADADLDLAATLVVKAGFGLTGQACTATSRVIVERSVVEAFTEKLVAQANAIKVDNGLAEGVQMGPAVNQQEFDGNFEAIAKAKAEGATLLCGGTRLEEGDLAKGLFMTPTVIGDVTPTMSIASEEVFGPVVAIIAVDDFDQAIEVANGVDVGLSASVVTRDIKKAMIYSNRIQVGVVKINQISTGLALQAPFGGVKKSSTDTFREQGPGAVDFYTRTKTVYLDYSA